MTAPDSPERSALSWWTAVLAPVVWLGLWFFVPGLHAAGIGSLLSDDDATQVLIETVVALALSLLLVALHRRWNRDLFARSWQVWLYSVPILLALVLPLHYGLPLPVAVYIFWMAVSVFFQDYLTFGLLQNYLAETLPRWAVIVATAVVFYLGHAIFIPQNFAPTNPLPALAILAVGAVFALLRARLKTLHLLLVLHLSFYFISA